MVHLGVGFNSPDKRHFDASLCQSVTFPEEPLVLSVRGCVTSQKAQLRPRNRHYANASLCQKNVTSPKSGISPKKFKIDSKIFLSFTSSFLAKSRFISGVRLFVAKWRLFWRFEVFLAKWRFFWWSDALAKWLVQVTLMWRSEAYSQFL